MQIAMSPTRQEFPLSSKKPMKKTIESMIIWAFLFVIFYAFAVAAFLSTSSGLVSNAGQLITAITIGVVFLFFIFFFLTYLYQRWYYEVYFYNLTDDFVVIKKGVLTPKEITIPYERIQDVYVDQDIFDRIFGLYDVHLASATVSSGVEAHIDGVEKSAADGLKELLLTTIHKHIAKIGQVPQSAVGQAPNE